MFIYYERQRYRKVWLSHKLAGCDTKHPLPFQSSWLLAWLTLRPGRWRQYKPPKRLWTSTAIRASNPTEIKALITRSTQGVSPQSTPLDIISSQVQNLCTQGYENCSYSPSWTVDCACATAGRNWCTTSVKETWVWWKREEVMRFQLLSQQGRVEIDRLSAFKTVRKVAYVHWKQCNYLHGVEPCLRCPRVVRQ
jgi:hypothetical protein